MMNIVECKQLIDFENETAVLVKSLKRMRSKADDGSGAKAFHNSLADRKLNGLVTHGVLTHAHMSGL